MLSFYIRFGKRLFDLLASSAALLLLCPLLLLTALFIRLEDFGPAIFRQSRVGASEQPFELFKYRSMPVNTSNVPSNALYNINITRIGKIIRRTNIDELPQLINIVRGDMSIVGPRPALPAQKKLLERRRKNGAIRMKPGLTGIAQLNSYDGMSEPEKADHDGVYVLKMSFLTDIKLVMKTFAYLLKRPPVY